MICPRCDSDRAHLLVEAPVGNAWAIFICDECDFSWRSTEGPAITDSARYAKKWKLNEQKIATMMTIPPVPPLRGK